MSVSNILGQDQSVEIQWQVESQEAYPDDAQIIHWAQAALLDKQAGVTIRIVDQEEIRASNRQWRGFDRATNVLSFSADFPSEAQVAYLGDILICAPVLEMESIQQNKTLTDHWAHIVIHGLLHLQGFDHENDADAEAMEMREREILATFDIADPYQDEPRADQVSNER